MIKILSKFILNHVPRPCLIRISYWVSPFLSVYFRGNRFEDPIDGKQYRKLLPYGYGGHQRENALAPGSMSLERHRLLFLYLKQHTDFFDPAASKSLLHIAPEQCFLKRFKKMKHLEYITGDLESPIADIKMDLHSIPFEEERFDIVLCNHVLEHVQNDQKCMQEVFRVLKPQGWAIMQVPLNMERENTDEDPTITDPGIRKIRFGQYDHVRAYGKDYPQRLERAGFKVSSFYLQQELGIKKVRKYGLDKDELLFVCRKE